MSTQSSRPFRLLLWGDYACFARPEMRVERVSYPIMTPAAARGALEAILWKPQIAWQVERIDRLRPTKFEQVRRNEVEVKASFDRESIVVDQVRQQRAALVLRDVAYLLHAHFRLTRRAGPRDSVAKYVAMFERRGRAGQCFQRPCLGSREFAAEFRLLEDNEPNLPTDGSNESLGWLFHDFDWSQRPPRPRFFEARLQAGCMVVPRADSGALHA